MQSLLLRSRTSGCGAPRTVAEVVTWFGAMQAQDLGSGLWSLGARLPGVTKVDVEAALERREALRTWPMRGTVHFIPPKDARWMLDLMGSRALARAAKRREFLGLTEEVADRAVDVLRVALASRRRMTRAECMTTLQGAGLGAGGAFGYHVLWYASQRGVTCIAPNRGSEQTFALLDDWAPDPATPSREQALGIIAERYFRSHGPATRKDFAGWTGLTMTDVRAGIAQAGDALAEVVVEGQPMVASTEILDSPVPGGKPERPEEVLALAGFDEFLLGFKDRTLMLAEEHKQAIVPGGNGMFRWTIVRDGRVIGVWTRKKTARKVVVEVDPLVRLTGADKNRVEAALEPYGRFVDLPLEVGWP